MPFGIFHISFCRTNGCRRRFLFGASFLLEDLVDTVILLRFCRLISATSASGAAGAGIGSAFLGWTGSALMAGS